MTLDIEDELMHATLTNGQSEIMMFSNTGKSVRYHEDNIRVVGRTARGVRGIKMQTNQNIVALISTNLNQGMVLTATENGYGKRTPVVNYRKTLRGSQGVIAISTSKRNGLVVSANLVDSENDIMLMTDQGTVVRIRVDEIRATGRSAQGVRLIKLKKQEKLVSIQVIYTGDEIIKKK